LWVTPVNERSKHMVLILLAISQYLLFGCATDPVAIDLTNYVNQGVLQIAELEQKSLERYAAVTGPNYRSDQEVYAALNNRVIPLYSRFLKGLRKIKPKTQQVRNLNRIYIRGSESLLDGFETLKVAIEQKDPKLVQVVNEKLEKGRMENEKWRKDLASLANKYGLKFTQANESTGTVDSILEILFGSGGKQM
jgi:hypothetical protein